MKDIIKVLFVRLLTGKWTLADTGVAAGIAGVAFIPSMFVLMPIIAITI